MGILFDKRFHDNDVGPEPEDAPKADYGATKTLGEQLSIRFCTNFVSFEASLSFYKHRKPMI